MKLEETPLIGEVSLILSHSISSQRLAAAIKACDAGVASPVEYAFVAACLPYGAGMPIPKNLLPSVRLVMESWKSHLPTLSRQFSDALVAAPKDAAVIPEIFTAKAASEVGIHLPLSKIRKIASGSFFGFFKWKITKKKSGCSITFCFSNTRYL